MRFPKEFYLHNFIRLKQALCYTVNVAHDLNDPDLLEEDLAIYASDWHDYVALQYHMAIAYLHKQDYSSAIILAECAKQDLLSLPGVKSYDLQMQPFYALLHECYGAAATQNKNMRYADAYQRDAELAYRYGKRVRHISMLHDTNQIYTPIMPNLNDPKYGQIYTSIGEEEIFDATFDERMSLLAKLLRLHKKEAHKHLKDDVLTAAQDAELSQIYLEYSQKLFASGDYKLGIYYAKRGERITLQLANYRSMDSSLLPFYKTLNDYYFFMAAHCHDPRHGFVKHATYYHIIALDMNEAQKEHVEAASVYTTSASVTPRPS